jgi:hypothetical protein
LFVKALSASDVFSEVALIRYDMTDAQLGNHLCALTLD